MTISQLGTDMETGAGVVVLLFVLGFIGIMGIAFLAAAVMSAQDREEALLAPILGCVGVAVLASGALIVGSILASVK